MFDLVKDKLVDDDPNRNSIALGPSSEGFCRQTILGSETHV